jgi:hypothetical protein
LADQKIGRRWKYFVLDWREQRQAKTTEQVERVEEGEEEHLPYLRARPSFADRLVEVDPVDGVVGAD